MVASATMVASNLKAETISLMDLRASMEAEMNAIIESLCGPACPGLSGNLVDAEGFPRTGSDISAVRPQRRRLAEDGLQLGDEVVKFGSGARRWVMTCNQGLWSKHTNEGNPVNRQDSMMNAIPIVTPRPWRGWGFWAAIFTCYGRLPSGFVFSTDI